MKKLFIELLQVSFGNREQLSRTPSDAEWICLFQVAQKQTVVGVLIAGIDKLPIEQHPPQNLLLQWIGLTVKVEQGNHLLNQRCIELQKLFSDAGFRTCILKGQGNAMMYPNPGRRQCGDIDIWVEGDKEAIVNFVVTKTPGVIEQYHHIDFPILKDVSVEVHFRPSYTNIFWYNKRLQDYFKENSKQQFINFRNLPDSMGKLCVPTTEFNIVFQMSHMMRHFMSEGIGFRQLIDYYYLLKEFHDGTSRPEDYTMLFKHLGLLKFAQGVMWVEKNILGIDENSLIVEPSERIGKLLLKEILSTGNFGHYDKRVAKKIKSTSLTLSLLAKNVSLIREFPLESLLSPVMGMWMWYGYKKVHK